MDILALSPGNPGEGEKTSIIILYTPIPGTPHILASEQREQADSAHAQNVKVIIIIIIIIIICFV